MSHTVLWTKKTALIVLLPLCPVRNVLQKNTYAIVWVKFFHGISFLLELAPGRQIGDRLGHWIGILEMTQVRLPFQGK
jgi:hypothetical protein